MIGRLQRLIAGLWLGSAFFMMLAAAAAFRAAATPNEAADVVGAMLIRWHYIALGAPLLLFFLELRRVRALVLVVLFVSIVVATLQGFADLRIRSIRASSDIPISSMRRDNPIRRQFGILHGISSGLLLMQGVLAAAVIMTREKSDA